MLCTKVAFNAVGHVLSKEDCEFISDTLKQSINLTEENKALREENAALSAKLKTKTYQIDPYRVLIVCGGDVTLVDATDEHTVRVRHL